MHLLGQRLRPMPGVSGIWSSDTHPVTHTAVTLLERADREGETRYRAELLVGERVVAAAIGATLRDVEGALLAELRRRLTAEARA